MSNTIHHLPGWAQPRVLEFLQEGKAPISGSVSVTSSIRHACDDYPLTMTHEGRKVGVSAGHDKLQVSVPQGHNFAIELPYPPKGQNLVWSFDIDKGDRDFIIPRNYSVKDGRYRFEFTSSDRAADFGDGAKIKFSLHNSVLTTPGYIKYPPVEERELRMDFSEGGVASMKPLPDKPDASTAAQAEQFDSFVWSDSSSRYQSFAIETGVDKKFANQIRKPS